jgi:hypothetical protein
VLIGLRTEWSGLVSGEEDYDVYSVYTRT